MRTWSVLLPVASILHGDELVRSLVDGVRPGLLAAGGHVVESVEAGRVGIPLAILILTGGTEQAALAAWAARQQLVHGEPLLLLAHPGHNSLAAALETLARLQRENARGRIVMLQDGAGGTTLDDAVRDLTVWHALHVARLGLLGTPSDWLVASVPDRDGVRRRWGITIVDADMPTALGRFEDNIDAPIAEPVQLHAREHAGAPHPAEVETAARFEPVLREVVAQHHLDAVTVRCFDLVTDAHTSGCLALSALNDSGIIAGCEGDVASAVGLMWAKHLTGRLGWMANPAMANTETGVIELAHCTVPLSLVADYELQTHFESGIGVGISGTLPPGPVTLLRIGGGELELLWCADGTAVPTHARAGRCRTQLDVQVEPSAVAQLLDRPLGNHVIVIAGHHAARLRTWWQEMIAAA